MSLVLYKRTKFKRLRLLKRNKDNKRKVFDKYLMCYLTSRERKNNIGKII